MFKQHVHDEILVPQHISKYGLMTAQSFIINILITYYLNVYYIMVTMICV